MRRRAPRHIASVFMVLLLAAALAGPLCDQAWAWGTGQQAGASYGTHGWIAVQGALMARRDGARWLNLGIAKRASVLPDWVFNDHIDHNYNRWGSFRSPYSHWWGTRFGNPQLKVRRYYNAMVKALIRGDKKQASRNYGIMSHYYADVCEPMHTQESALETLDMHQRYETAVDSMLRTTNSHKSWLHDDGYQYVPDTAAFTIATANKSHSYYWSLVRNFAHGGFNSTVSHITAVEVNRAVNGLADLIGSAQYDSDAVAPQIMGVSPSTATSGQPVTFSGRGTDPHHAIVAWQWRSSIDGVLSTSSSFTTSTLSVGIHTIYLKVECSNGKWSKEAGVSLVVGAPGTRPVPVYRFRNRKNGGFYLTASESERNHIIAKASATYAFEGIGYALDASSTANTQPLYKFLNIKHNYYYYTANEAETATLIATQKKVWRYQGSAWNVSLSPTGTVPVYRFHNRKNGVFLWTSSAAEQQALLVKHKTYAFDGVAYYFAPPW